MPARLPLAPLVTLAVSCALMGVMLGVWIGWQRVTPAQRMEVRLPPLLPPGPALSQPAAPRQYYPVPRPTGLPPLPPARVVPSEGRQATGDRRPFGMGWGAPPGARVPSAPIRRAAAPAGPRAPLRAKGMATVHISNPSDRAIDVTLSGAGEQSGVVGPRSAVDFLIPPGRYDVALRGAARTQRFYDAPLTEGDVLELVYSEKP
jgi:hypothetical protein